MREMKEKRTIHLEQSKVKKSRRDDEGGINLSGVKR